MNDIEHEYTQFISALTIVKLMQELGQDVDAAIDSFRNSFLKAREKSIEVTNLYSDALYGLDTGDIDLTIRTVQTLYEGARNVE